MLKEIKKRSSVLLLLFVFIVSTLSAQDVSTFDFKTGDIIFQSSNSGQSKAVQLATNSKFSHVGIIFIENNEVYVLEAVQPVCKTKVKNWVKAGDGNKFWVKRLSDPKIFDKTENCKKLYDEYTKYEGKNYDIFFNWSNKEIYCSELVWKIYKSAFEIELCSLKKLKTFDLSHKEVKRIMAIRYGDNIPYDEYVVAPSDIYKSKLLITIP